ncbi:MULTISPECIES: chromosome segregation protein SMC [unclassified Mesotoga]|uniref:chromosome segregation protein SMC n=1 Tax=unclassified Mesotoga TaxID=1184398 RepID=UPI001BD3D6E1|nr:MULTISPECIES: chromosome segregation protein SMC [unclassified Mesotoga]MDD3460576.1 chromosome segregation protein SMC [Mesotoga sp.]HNS34916.1 chromosome segregation protein SMC [Mesotoga sp.]
MNNIDELLERLFEALESDTSDRTDEEKVKQALKTEFSENERETLMGVLDSLFGEVTKMAENPKNYFFSNEQEKLDKYLAERDKKVDSTDQ